MPLQQALDVALACAADGARIARSGLGRARDIVRKQSPGDLVTEFDIAVERVIVERLRAAFPDDAIIGEEGTQVDGARRWYVDPIDGTTNFAHGLPFFGISIGLVDEAGPAVGVVVAPALGWRFFAQRGGGAWLSEHDAEPRRLEVSRTAVLLDALLATGFPYDLRTSPDDNVAQFTALQRDAQAVRRVGAASLDLAMVAAGWFDGYWERKLKPWDVAAGLLLVTESGGRVSGFTDEPVDLHSGRIVATNGRIHKALVAALGRCNPPV
ncbi:MAG: inositol monophosphatase family protein [Polyangia bacterium]